jgi:hypothetical protein
LGVVKQRALGATPDLQPVDVIWVGSPERSSESQELEAHPEHWVLLAMAIDPGMFVLSSIPYFLSDVVLALARIQIHQQNFPWRTPIRSSGESSLFARLPPM